MDLNTCSYFRQTKETSGNANEIVIMMLGDIPEKFVIATLNASLNVATRNHSPVRRT
jgi:hypothetical protein